LTELLRVGRPVCIDLSEPVERIRQLEADNARLKDRLTAMSDRSSRLTRDATDFRSILSRDVLSPGKTQRLEDDCRNLQRKVSFVDKKLSYRRDSACRLSLRGSRSFKVIDLGNSRKPVCDFRSVNNTNLHHIFHLFQVIANLRTVGQIFCFPQKSTPI